MFRLAPKHISWSHYNGKLWQIRASPTHSAVRALISADGRTRTALKSWGLAWADPARCAAWLQEYPRANGSGDPAAVLLCPALVPGEHPSQALCHARKQAAQATYTSTRPGLSPPHNTCSAPNRLK